MNTRETNKIQPEILRQMHELCNKIYLAHDVDDPVREELLGHMEDKLQAYLSGEEHLSEQDAFILVREHFGDPAVVKACMQEAHPVEVTASLARRLIAVAVAAMGLSALMFWVTLPVYILFGRYAALGGNALLVNTCSVVSRVVPLALLWLILLRWERMMSARRKPCFLTQRPRTFIFVFILLVAALCLTGFGHMVYIGAFTTNVYVPSKAFTYGLYYAAATVSCLIWIWWCDRPPRRIRTMVATAAAWLLFPALRVIGSLTGSWIGYVVTITGAADIKSGHLAYHTQVHHFLLETAGLALRMSAGVTFPCAAAAIGLYLIYRFSRRDAATTSIIH